jgi:outer membrane lipoprotein SlyB
MKMLGVALCIVSACLLATGCASSRSGEVYSRDQARKAQTVQMGTVQSVKAVKIEGTKSPVGAIAGGAVGGALGQTIGSGTGRTVATVLGVVGGAVGGSLAEEELTKKDGLEITVKLDEGKVISVVQEADVYFQVGERARVQTGPDGTTRVNR